MYTSYISWFYCLAFYYMWAKECRYIVPFVHCTFVYNNILHELLLQCSLYTNNKQF